MSHMKHKTVCVVGLGYVGLPLAKAFSQTFRKSLIKSSFGKAFLSKKRFICVPTPVTKSKEPDLSYVKSAAEIIGKNFKKGAIVVLESTFYPGVIEEIVAPILERESGLTCGIDFKIGYSPERINPGDEAHALNKITKIVAGMDDETTETLAELYGLITTVYKAKDIKTAEAA